MLKVVSNCCCIIGQEVIRFCLWLHIYNVAGFKLCFISLISPTLSQELLREDRSLFFSGMCGYAWDLLQGLGVPKKSLDPAAYTPSYVYCTMYIISNVFCWQKPLSPRKTILGTRKVSLNLQTINGFIYLQATASARCLFGIQTIHPFHGKSQ